MKMAKLHTPEFQWFACRVKRKQLGGIRSVTVGGDFEAYRDRSGRMRKRRVNGTGSRVFLPEHLLRRAGFEVFLPVKKVLRRKNRFTPEKTHVTQPLLADWLFVGWRADIDRWNELMDLEVISGVMGTGGRPAAIPSDRVARLMRQWGGGRLSRECKKMAEQPQPYNPGEVVKVPDGPFVDFDFKIVDVTARAARGVINIFGRETPLEVPIEKLPERIAEEHPALSTDLSLSDPFDPELSACICGHRAAQVLPDDSGYCVACGNCGGRAARWSQDEITAKKRWNTWVDSMTLSFSHNVKRA